MFRLLVFFLKERLCKKIGTTFLFFYSFTPVADLRFVVSLYRLVSTIYVLVLGIKLENGKKYIGVKVKRIA